MFLFNNCYLLPPISHIRHHVNTIITLSQFYRIKVLNFDLFLFPPSEILAMLEIFLLHKWIKLCLALLKYLVQDIHGNHNNMLYTLCTNYRLLISIRVLNDQPHQQLWGVNHKGKSLKSGLLFLFCFVFLVLLGVSFHVRPHVSSAYFKAL